MNVSDGVTKGAGASMVIVITGVSGSGKSTVGRLLAQRLDWPFVDADDLHPPSNIATMRAGSPLSEAQRRPWLRAVRTRIQEVLERGGRAVLACSALKRAHREFLYRDGVQFVYLRGDFELFRRRLELRKGHFFDPQLLASQFETLEAPTCALTIDAAQTPAQIASEIVRRLEPGSAQGVGVGKQ